MKKFAAFSVLIYDIVGNRIITAIEILSPWNSSPGKALQAYLQKREKYLNSEINLVEIDLIRAGDWTEMIGWITLGRANPRCRRRSRNGRMD